MTTTNELLDSLKNDKKTLVTKLNEKGIEASADETFTTLCPKVGDIKQVESQSKVLINKDTGNLVTVGPFINYIKSFSNVQISENVTNLGALFRAYSNVEEIDISNLNFSNINSVQAMFYLDSKLIYINMENLDFGNVNNIQLMFDGCSSLKTLKFPNNLGKNFKEEKENNNFYKISFAVSKNLEHETLLNIFNKLYDLNLTYNVANGGTLYTQQLVIGPENIKKCSPEEIAIATAKGWTVS